VSYHTWYTDQERPGIPIVIYDTDGTSILALASGYTATVQLVKMATSTIVVTQSADITLASTSPNLTISKWSATTLTAVAADLLATGRASQDYEVRPYVRLTADSTDEVPTSTEQLIVTFRPAAA